MSVAVQGQKSDLIFSCDLKGCLKQERVKTATDMTFIMVSVRRKTDMANYHACAQSHAVRLFMQTLGKL